MQTTTKPHRIFAEFIEEAALAQFYNALSQDFAVKGALLPDVHTGYSLPIGAVVATRGVVVPAWVGYDIGCGMCAVPTGFVRAEIEAHGETLFKSIYRAVPVGFNHNRADTPWAHSRLARSTKMAEIFNKNGLRQLGSLGSGNHFIEIGYDEGDRMWIIVHSGSRGIGHTAASHYMKLASGGSKAKEGHFGFATDSKSGQDYITDMNFCLEFALENRHEIIRRVVREIQHHCCGDAEWSRLINRNHNHAEEKDGLWIHRKGATHAEAGMMGVIPGNMRDGSFIVEGKGNPESLWSSSHGAGRVLGRKAAKKSLRMADFAATMRGIVAKVDTSTLDESPFAYRDIFKVMKEQADMVFVHHRVTPIVNIKG
jgi:tRNA-splicing ligase RtcB